MVSRNGTQQWHPAMAPTMASSNGTLPRHPAMAPRPVCQSVITSPPIASSNGTLPHSTQQWHLTMAPSNGTTSSLSKCVITTPRLLHPAMAAAMAPSTQQWHLTTWHPPWHPAMAPYHGTQQWHHVQSIASSNGTQQWHLTTWHPAMASMQQWHRTMTPTMASYHRTLPWHPAMAPRPVCHRLLHPAMAPSNGTLPHGTQQWHLTMAPDHMPPSNGSQQRQCHPAMAAQQWHPPIPSNGSPAMAAHQWQPATAPRPIFELVHHNPLLLEVRTPIAKAIWGKMQQFVYKHIELLGGVSLPETCFVRPVFVYPSKIK